MILVLALACSPLDTSSDVYSEPSTTEGTDTPSLTITPFASLPAMQYTDDPWFSTILIFDLVEGEGDGSDVQEPALVVHFADSPDIHTEIGHAEIGPQDPTEITSIDNLVTGCVLTSDEILNHSAATMVTDMYEDLGDMVPTIGDDGISVTYTPPP